MRLSRNFLSILPVWAYKDKTIAETAQAVLDSAAGGASSLKYQTESLVSSGEAKDQLDYLAQVVYHMKFPAVDEYHAFALLDEREKARQKYGVAKESEFWNESVREQNYVSHNDMPQRF